MRFVISRIQRFRDVVRRRLGIWLFDRKKDSSFDLTEAESILFIRNDAKLGDAIVSSGVIRKLRKYRPDLKVMVLTTPGMMQSLFLEHFGVDRVINLSKRPSYKEIRGVSQQVGSVDVVVSLNPDMKMKDIYLMKCLHSKANVGLDSELKLINFKINKNLDKKHYAEKFDYISKLVGIDKPKENYMVPLIKESLDKAQQFLDDNGINDFVLVNPFGSGNERKLNKASITKIIDAVKDNGPAPHVILLSAPDTKELLDSMSLTSGMTHHFDQSDSIYDAIAMVEKAKLVVSVDTSIVHIASGLEKKQISIYRSDPMNFANWSPNSEFSIVLESGIGINSFSKEELKSSFSKLDL